MMAEKMRPGDPAYWMLERGISDESWRSVPEVFEPGCYICEDAEFALMGLPLCKPCGICRGAGTGDGHIPADDVVCTVCGETDPAYSQYLDSKE